MKDMTVTADEMVVAVVNEITSRIDAALAQAKAPERRSSELVAASHGLDAEAAALGDRAEVQARVERLRLQLAQLSDPVAVAEQRQVMSHAAERLREAARAHGRG